MTKDRRLGRGLAALLGTPLDETQLAEGTDASSQDTMPSPNPSGSQSSQLASPPRSSSPRAHQPASPLAAGSRPSTAAKMRAHNASTGVTGAVPLDSVLGSGATGMPRDASETSSVSRDAAPASSGGVRELDVNLIDANPFQPRRQFHPEEIAALAESLKEHQQLQPVLVRQVGSRYQLISGERRLRAAIHAGLARVRAEVREADDRLVAELAIVENLQRKDLNPIEKALSFRRYLDQHTCTQDELAKRLKIDRSTIANLMRLLELPESILEAVQADKLSAGHARALLPLGDETQQLTMAARIQAEGWNVRQTEHNVTEILAREEASSGSMAVPKSRRSSARTVTPQIGALEQELRRALGTKIEIKQSARGRGKIVVHFHSAEEFERIRELLVPASQRAAA